LKCLKEEEKKCMCGETTNNAKCAEMHLKYCNSKNQKQCNKCGIKYSNLHVCFNQKYCKSCRKVVPLDNHKCFIRKHKNNIIKKEKIYSHYIFFDFETKVDEKTNEHVVNLAVAKKVCLTCMNNLDEKTRCDECQKYYQFSNISDFCKWLLEHKNTIVIAHNLKGYDGIFIYNYFLNNMRNGDTLTGLSTITNGSKLMAIMW